jgi:hypothetical protein
MKETTGFDANRRLAQVALWTESAARWIEQATAQERHACRRDLVTLTLKRSDLELFVSGLDSVAKSLLGLALPVPPVVPVPPVHKKPRLRLVP